MVTKEERREQKRIYLKECRAFWRAHGICTKCGKEKAFHTYTLCAECMDKERERKRNYVRSDEQKAKEAERMRTKRAEHKKLGLCANCNRKATPGYAYCADCRMIMKRSNQEWVVRSGRKKGYADRGLCIRCGAEPEDGKKLCADCLEKQRERMAYARQFARKDSQWMVR